MADETVDKRLVEALEFKLRIINEWMSELKATAMSPDPEGGSAEAVKVLLTWGWLNTKRDEVLEELEKGQVSPLVKRLEEIAKRLGDITPQEWYTDETGNKEFDLVRGRMPGRMQGDAVVFQANSGEDPSQVGIVTAWWLLSRDSGRFDTAHRNAVFVANAPDDIRFLLLELKKAHETLALLHGDRG